LNENAKKCHQLQKLSLMLKNSKKGLVNLHKTYSDDANVTARLDEVMDKIDQQFDAILSVLEYMKIEHQGDQQFFPFKSERNASKKDAQVHCKSTISEGVLQRNTISDGVLQRNTISDGVLQKQNSSEDDEDELDLDM
jgi:hypothetical protein